MRLAHKFHFLNELISSPHAGYEDHDFSSVSKEKQVGISSLLHSDK